jgi:hypothetical protein
MNNPKSLQYSHWLVSREKIPDRANKLLAPKSGRGLPCYLNGLHTGEVIEIERPEYGRRRFGLFGPGLPWFPMNFCPLPKTSCYCRYLLQFEPVSRLVNNAREESSAFAIVQNRYNPALLPEMNSKFLGTVLSISAVFAIQVPDFRITQIIST